MEVDDEVDHCTRQLKMLFVLGDNGGNRTDCLKFLHEFELYRSQYDDSYIPPDLRKLVALNEKSLGLALTKHTKECSDCWSECLIEPIKYRDNDQRQMREMFDDNYKIWLPICDYEIREYWAQNYCGCSHCMWKSRLRDYKKDGISTEGLGNCPKLDNGKCTKNSFYLPYAERDDDCGVMDHEG